MSIFDNGGFIGRIADYTDTSQYVITEGSLDPSPLVFVGSYERPGLGTTSTITIPITSRLTGGTDSSAQEGDLVIVAIELCGITDKSYRIEGYTEIADLYISDTEDSNLQVGYKFMGATPDTEVNITGGTGSTADASAAVIYVWRGVDPANPVDVTPVTNSQNNTGIPNPPAITPITSGAEIIVVAGTAHTGGTDTFTASYLSNFASVGANDGNDATVGIGSISWASGEYDPAAWTWSQSDSTAFSTNAVTFALRPLVTVVEEVLGNQKNSGIWSLNTVWATKTLPAGVTIVGHYNATDLNFDYGTGLTDLQVGDVLFLTAASSFGLYDYDGGPNDPRPSPVAGNGFVTVVVVDGGLSYYVCYKVLTAENISTTTVYTGNGQAYAQVIQVRGLDLAQLESFNDGFQDRLLDTSIRTTSSGTGAVDPPSITASASGSLILAINIVGGTLSMTAPTEYTLINSYSYNNGVARSISSGYKNNTTGVQDPGSFSSNPSNLTNARVTFALAPLTDGGGGGGSPSDQEVFTTSNSFIVPTDVTSVSAAVVGAGGGGGASEDSDETGGGGGGGGLAYETFAVTPGETLTVTVGAGGTGAGGASSISRGGTLLVAANGGGAGQSRGNGGAGGTVTTGTGGTGGAGGAGSDRASTNAGGGGGAGGYSGNGGSGGSAANTGSATAGSGGGGGGGGGGTNNSTRGGGGVGILGEGVNGAAGAANVSGSGGSGGSIGTNIGGSYGGGGRGAAGTSTAGSAGAPGAVRIIWGTGRAYPSTNTADV